MSTSPDEPTVKLLAASQPDIVRANQKDESYIDQYVESTYEVVRRLAGPFRALQYARESKLLALLLYHGLTTGLGQATLGEEYCAMRQVAETGYLPGPRRRLLLALLLSLGPYAADRMAAQLDIAAEGVVEEETAAAALEEAADAGPASCSRTHPAHEKDESGDWRIGERPTSELEVRQVSGQAVGIGPSSRMAAAVEAGDEAGRLRQGRATTRGGAAGRRAGGSRVWRRLLVAAALTRWSRSWRALVLAWPRFRPFLVYAGRLHLAIFYAYGAYYTLAHRLAGVRYSLSTRPLQGRPSYGVLGALLGLQLAVVAAIQARSAWRDISRQRAAAAAAAVTRRGGRGQGTRIEGEAREDGEERFYAAEGEPAVFLDEELLSDNDWNSDEEQGPDEAIVPASEVAVSGVMAGPGGDSAGGLGGRKAPGVFGSGGEAMEGWEEVERLDDTGGSGWEVDVFGVQPTQLPAAPPSRRHPQQQDVRTGPISSGELEEAVSTTTAPGRASAKDESTNVRRRHPRGGAAADSSSLPAVLPLLTSLRPCPLCLSPKSHPTSTPCGHTFCWSCITTWCVEKPECPLCRSAVRLPQLVALYHTNC